MECAGNGRARLEPRPVSQPWLVEAVGTAEWTGTPLRLLLEEAELLDDAVEIVFTGLDHGMEGGIEQDYARSLSIAETSGDDVLLAYEMNGEPLLPQHGFPLRLVVPGWYGMTNVKWLARITAVAEPFTGFQQAEGYRLLRDRDDPGEPVTRMAPRALMVPPGFPDFMTRRRFVAPGKCPVRGRAWSGLAPVTQVQAERRPRRHLARRSARRRRPRAVCLAFVELDVGAGTGLTTSCGVGRATRPATSNPSTPTGTSRDTPTTPCSVCP